MIKECPSDSSNGHAQNGCFALAIDHFSMTGIMLMMEMIEGNDKQWELSDIEFYEQ